MNPKGARSGIAQHANFETGPQPSATQLELVLLLGVSDPDTTLARAWRDACVTNGFGCIASRDENEHVHAPLWERVHLIALLGAQPPSRTALERLRSLAPQALMVLCRGPQHVTNSPPKASLEADSYVGDLGVVQLAPGQELALLAWYRRHLVQSPTIEVIPRPLATVNLTERTLSLDNEVLSLQPRELQLLVILAQHTQTSCPADLACQLLLGGVDAPRRRLLRQHLYQLRQKLGRYAGLLLHIRGEGYRCKLEFKFVEVT